MPEHTPWQSYPTLSCGACPASVLAVGHRLRRSRHCFRHIDRAMIRHPLCRQRTLRYKDKAISATPWRVASMLDRFKVPLEDQVHVSDAELRKTVAAILEKCNLTPEDA